MELEPSSILALILFGAVGVALMLGFPVAFTLSGVSILFAFLGQALGLFDFVFYHALPARIFGIMSREILVAIPLFILMGTLLERSGVAEDLLVSVGKLFGRLGGGLGYGVVMVGALLAASTGIVGAAVVTMGLLSLPTMLRNGYDPRLACGTVCAAGTLGQIIPPSIALILLGDMLAGSYTQSQLSRGQYDFEPVSVIDLFAGALFPGLMLVGLYLLWLVVQSVLRPERSPPLPAGEVLPLHRVLREVSISLLPPVFLMVLVLGSILGGIATPTEAASLGVVGALGLVLARGRFSFGLLHKVLRRTLEITAMVFGILVGATVFALTFRALGGDKAIEEMLLRVSTNPAELMLIVMVALFLLGFVLDFIEILFVVVPVVAPPLFALGVDPIWLGVMIGMNLQTSFMTPPFGWSLFYIRGVTPQEVSTIDIYRGVIPFVGLQLVGLALLATFPGLATWLPKALFGN